MLIQPDGMIRKAGRRCAREAVFFHVRLRQGEGLGKLMVVIERVTPLAQSLAPSAAIAQVGGALRLFSVGPVGPVGLAQRLRLQAAALYSLGTVVGIGSSWSVAVMASLRTGASGVLHVPTGRRAGAHPADAGRRP
jgi:DNA polymerase-4